MGGHWNDIRDNGSVEQCQENAKDVGQHWENVRGCWDLLGGVRGGKSKNNGGVV